MRIDLNIARTIRGLSLAAPLGAGLIAALAGCTPEPARAPFEFQEGPLVQSSAPSVPITGGTLLVSNDRALAIAADPERDIISIVDLATASVRATITLPARSEPGRIAEDASGRIHVALRRGGDVAHIDLATGVLLGTTHVCAAPRGIAYDRANDALHIACQGGELVTLSAAGEEIARTNIPGGDLRDVIVRQDALLVTRFRSAHLTRVGYDGEVQTENAPPPDFSGCGGFSEGGFGEGDFASPRRSGGGGGDSSTAWRAIALTASPTGADVMMVHQRAQTGQTISVDTGGYGGGGECNPVPGIVKTSVSTFDGQGNPLSTRGAIPEAVLAVDIAVSADGTHVAMAMPGNLSTPFAQVRVSEINDFMGGDSTARRIFTDGQVTAVAFAGNNRLLVQSHEPATITIEDLSGGAARTITLSSESRADSGNYLFHAGATAMVACASCHAEGGDDGRTWDFDSIGPRRTQSIAGGILGTEPFHWDGDMADFRMLEHQVFGKRMGAGDISLAHADALGHFVDRLTPVPNSEPTDLDAVARGQELFESEEVGCASCHSGPMLTNNASVDVGTGGIFQVPTLIGVSHHSPYLHTGCAPRLRDRFDPACGGGERHGKTAHLSYLEIDDLIAYLNTL